MTWLGFGQRFLNWNHALLKWISAASYPLYLLNPMVLLPADLLLMQWQANAFVGFVVLTMVTLIGTVALTALLQR